MGISEADEKKIREFTEQITKDHDTVMLQNLFGKLRTNRLNLHFYEWDYDKSAFIEYPVEEKEVETYIADRRAGKFVHIAADLTNGGVLDMPMGAFDENGICYLGRHRVFFTYPA